MPILVYFLMVSGDDQKKHHPKMDHAYPLCVMISHRLCIRLPTINHRHSIPKCRLMSLRHRENTISRQPATCCFLFLSNAQDDS